MPLIEKNLQQKKVLGLLEHIFGRAAKRANPIVRDVLESGAWGDAAVRITDFWIIDVAAKRADILIHIFSSKGGFVIYIVAFS